MDEDWRNAFGILMCTEICDGTGMGICDGAPLSSSSLYCGCSIDKEGKLPLHLLIPNRIQSHIAGKTDNALLSSTPVYLFFRHSRFSLCYLEI